MACRSKSVSNADRARDAWGTSLPRYIAMLASECDKSTQNAVAVKLQRSSGYISRLLSRTYTGSWTEAESLVLGAFSEDTVTCPMFGAIALKTCLRARRRKGNPINIVHRQYAQACPTCPNNSDRKED
jgi:hypothetical protein